MLHRSTKTSGGPTYAVVALRDGKSADVTHDHSLRPVRPRRIAREGNGACQREQPRHPI